MAEETLYTIGQLAELAGVTPRTIRYYTAEGLLPRPDSRGQYALYGEQHLLRLQLIGHLKETYLPLGEIKARIENLDVEQIRALLEEHAAPPAPPASAADYLAQIRARQQLPQPARSLAERAESYAAETPMLSVRPPASAQPASSPAAPTYGFAAPIAAPAPAAPPAEEAESGSSPQQNSLLRKLMPQRRARSEPAAVKDELAEAEQRWRRVELAPGVELHIREPAVPALHERIERLIALARALFKSGD
jgi:DNA-binding transcriptional MerR regulator